MEEEVFCVWYLKRNTQKSSEKDVFVSDQMGSVMLMKIPFWPH